MSNGFAMTTKVCLALLMGWMTLPVARGAGIVATYTFTGGTDGGTPSGGVIQAANGVLYGTSVSGGGMNGFGTIFKVTTNGAFKPLYTLTEVAANGGAPYAGLIMAGNSLLYGVACAGGSNGYGSIFKITTNGAFTELFGFNALRGAALTNLTGAYPVAALVPGANGNYYGTAQAGGANGFGSIFEITTNGAFTLLHYFTNGPGGAYPGALFQSANGLIYGTATNGGASGDGVIFKMTPAGQVTPMYSFTNGVDGAFPGPALAQGGNGILYGTASGGGSNGSGVIYQITTNGVFTPLYSFAASGQDQLLATTNADGLDPGPLLWNSSGNLYGFTRTGGLNGTGSLFQFTPGVGLTTLYSFFTGPQQGSGIITNALGANPTGIMLGGDGNLYGTAKSGGAYGFGAVFQVVGLPPLITSPPSNRSVALGGTAIFTVAASALSCQWQFNGVPIPNATNFAVTNLNVQIANAGAYQAVLGNNYGSVTSSAANLNITNIPVSFAAGPGAIQYAGGQLTVVITNLTGQGSVIIARSTNLTVWTPVFTNPPGFGQFQFMDVGAGGHPSAFYRAQFIPGQ
jgi:uncharacterized repeat protein (TIGR03803 family)